MNNRNRKNSIFNVFLAIQCISLGSGSVIPNILLLWQWLVLAHQLHCLVINAYQVFTEYAVLPEIDMLVFPHATDIIVAGYVFSEGLVVWGCHSFLASHLDGWYIHLVNLFGILQFLFSIY